MEAITREDQKQKNSNLSVLLILINLVLVFLYCCFSYFGRDLQPNLAIWLGAAFIFLTGGYAFSYHGKSYSIGKWIFGLALIIGAVIFGLLWYGSQLAHAFQH